jgi:hypothetical protein
LRNVGGCCHSDAPLLTFTSPSVVASKRDKSRLVTLPAPGVVAMSAAGTLPAPQTCRTRSAIYRRVASSRLHTRASRLRCTAAATDAAAEKKKARQRSSGCEDAQQLFPLVHTKPCLLTPPLQLSHFPLLAQQAVSFPFVKIVGQEDMKLALQLNVVDPRIGGVLIMGDRGTGKSVAVRTPASPCLLLVCVRPSVLLLRVQPTARDAGSPAH